MTRSTRRPSGPSGVRSRRRVMARNYAVYRVGKQRDYLVTRRVNRSAALRYARACNADPGAPLHYVLRVEEKHVAACGARRGLPETSGTTPRARRPQWEE